MRKFLFMFILSCLIVGVTPLLDGKNIQTNEELSSLRNQDYMMELGYPFPFFNQSIPSIDPPMPYTFGLNLWNFRSFNYLNFIASASIVYILLELGRRLLFIKKPR